MKARAVRLGILEKAFIKSFLMHPANIFIKLIYVPVQMLMYVFLWVTISRTSEIDVEYMVCYYLLTTMLGYAYPFRHICADVQSDVMEGIIISYLVRPVEYMTRYLAHYLAWMLIYSAIFVPSLLFVYFYRGLSAGQFFGFVLLVIPGMLIQFLLWYSVGLISFFLERIRGVIIAVSAIYSFISGALVPLHYLGTFWERVSALFPFRHYIYTPVNALLDKISGYELIQYLIMSLLWISILYLLATLLWQKGMRKIKTNLV